MDHSPDQKPRGGRKDSWTGWGAARDWSAGRGWARAAARQEAPRSGGAGRRGTGTLGAPGTSYSFPPVPLQRTVFKLSSGNLPGPGTSWVILFPGPLPAQASRLQAQFRVSQGRSPERSGEPPPLLLLPRDLSLGGQDLQKPGTAGGSLGREVRFPCVLPSPLLGKASSSQVAGPTSPPSKSRRPFRGAGWGATRLV